MVIGMSINLSETERITLGYVALAGLKATASLDGPPSPKAMAAIASLRDHILQIEVDLDQLKPLQPQELAQKLMGINPDPQWRERVLRGMTLVAMFDGEPSAKHLQFLRRAAHAFQIDDAPVAIYRRSMGDRLMLLRLDIIRRSFMAEAIKTSVRHDGLRGVLATAKVILGYEDQEMAKRYRALADYPDGTFGKAYADFILNNDFSFPGEVGGPPPPVMHHDCCHVLGGYGTTPNEEAGVVGFQAGFEKLDPFDVVMFIMAEFELGIGVSPYIPGEKSQLDPAYIFAGIEHGRQVNTDLLADINPWDYFSHPLEEVRQRFNVVPRGRKPDYA